MFIVEGLASWAYLGRTTCFHPSGGSLTAPEASSLEFAFDRVYKGAGTSRMLLKEMTEPVIQQYLKGFNATVRQSSCFQKLLWSACSS